MLVIDILCHLVLAFGIVSSTAISSDDSVNHDLISWNDRNLLHKRNIITYIISKVDFYSSKLFAGNKVTLTSSKISYATSTSRGSLMAAASTQTIVYISTATKDTMVLKPTTVYLTQTISASTTINTASVTMTASKGVVPSPASGRGKWLPGYDIHTDYTKNMPIGQLRHFDLYIDDTTIIAPDGYPRTAQLFNGQFPGPEINVNWGDLVEVRIINRSKINGTSIHWHGQPQVGSVEMDGVVGITQCPIPPSSAYTYRFRAQRYGPSWYHSHYSVQYANGAYGRLMVNGPSSADYDFDLGGVLIGDWYHEDSFVEMRRFFTGGPPASDSIVINGKGVHIDPVTKKRTGSYADLTGLQPLIPGKKYRMSLINSSTDTKFVFSIDNHVFTVMQTDYVPIVPYETDHQFIGIGQRYDIVLTATKAMAFKNVWFRASPQAACGDNVISNATARAIMRYAFAPLTEPTTTEVVYMSTCADPPLSALEPVVPLNVLPAHQQVDIGVTVLLNASQALVFDISGTDSANKAPSSLFLNLNHPTLNIINDGFSNFPSQYNVNFVNGTATDWVYFNITNNNAIPHPMHLHGHDFSILSTGVGPWDGTVSTKNPPRRDVAMVPSNGHLVMGFQTDNPGTWVMHCHIAFHVAAGLGMQFVENLDRINQVANSSLTYKNCDAWDLYSSYNLVHQEDSGI